MGLYIILKSLRGDVVVSSVWTEMGRHHHDQAESMHKAPNHIYALPLRTQIDGLIKMPLFPSLMMLRANRTIPFSRFGFPSQLWIRVFGSHSNYVQLHMVYINTSVLYLLYISSTLLYHSILLPRILNYTVQYQWLGTCL